MRASPPRLFAEHVAENNVGRVFPARLECGRVTRRPSVLHEAPQSRPYYFRSLATFRVPTATWASFAQERNISTILDTSCSVAAKEDLPSLWKREELRQLDGDNIEWSIQMDSLDGESEAITTRPDVLHTSSAHCLFLVSAFCVEPRAREVSTASWIRDAASEYVARHRRSKYERAEKRRGKR